MASNFSGLSAPPGSSLVDSKTLFDNAVTFTVTAPATFIGPLNTPGGITLNGPTSNTNVGVISNALLTNGTTVNNGVFNGDTVVQDNVTFTTNGLRSRYIEINSMLPTINLGNAFGLGSTVTNMIGHDLAGSFTVSATNGAAVAGGELFTVLFSSTLPGVPVTVLVQGYSGTTSGSWFYPSTTSDTFATVLATSGTTLTNGTYTIHYVFLL